MSRRIVVVALLCGAALLAPVHPPAAATGARVIEAAFTGNGGVGCNLVGPGTCPVSATSTTCRMVITEKPVLSVAEPCIATLSGTANIIVMTGTTLCTGIGSGTVTLRRTNGFLLERVDVTLVIAAGTLAWEGFQAIVPSYVVVSEGAIELACGTTAFGVMTGALTAIRNV